MGRLVRGKHADRMNQESYSVTLHNEDGITSIIYVSPEEVKERQAKRLTQGYKVSYDKVMGK